jgi:hypothetical protein
LLGALHAGFAEVKIAQVAKESQFRAVVFLRELTKTADVILAAIVYPSRPMQPSRLTRT